MAEMAGGNIDSDMEARIRREYRQLAYGFRDDIAGEGNNQIMFLSQGDKHVRGDPPLARIVPAQQDLHADALLITRIHQRLAEQLKFAGGKAEIYLPGKAHPVCGGQPGDIAQ